MKIACTKFYSRARYLSATASPEGLGDANAHPFATSRKDSDENNFTGKLQPSAVAA